MGALTDDQRARANASKARAKAIRAAKAGLWGTIPLCALAPFFSFSFVCSITYEIYSLRINLASGCYSSRRHVLWLSKNAPSCVGSPPVDIDTVGAHYHMLIVVSDDTMLQYTIAIESFA